MKAPDGQWTGISIELWQRVAERLNLKYRFVEEQTVEELLDGTAAGKFDAAVAALTITAARAERLEFSQPFYSTGLGIAVPHTQPTLWVVMINTVFSSGFLQAVGALIGLSLLVGLLIWIFERRRNEHFGGSKSSGLGAAIWWSAEAMTQASTGNRVPITTAGRTLAILWMAASIIVIAIFTAGVTSALTTRALQGLVNSPEDLSRVRVGAVGGSATNEYLDNARIKRLNFSSAKDGLEALRAGRIDAFVYDRPLLAWVVLHEFSSTIQVLDVVFDPQTYGIALPPGSPIRKEIDVVLLDAIRTDWWKQTLFQHLGQR